MSIKEQRKVEINNFDNVGKILKAEKDMIDKYVKQRTPVLNREQKDVMGPALANLQFALGTVLGHLEGRIKELEKLNEEK